jgi:hypothetical protein
MREKTKYFRAFRALFLRGVTLILRGQTIENTANPNDPDFCENIFWRKYKNSINTANPNKPLVSNRSRFFRQDYLSRFQH